MCIMPMSALNVSDEVLAEDAFARVKPELAKLARKDLVQVNLDVSAAVQTVLGVLPEVKALRHEIVKELPSFDLTSFDQLEDYALTLSAAHTAFLTAKHQQDDLRAVSAEAATLRETLASDAKALARRHSSTAGDSPA
jgi:hypothetical protein